jgi:murein DD-endopeptidase MepM/ murein hydrolase activator NlpD
MPRRLATLALLITVALGGAVSAGADTNDDRKRAIDEKISRLRDRIAGAQERESVLTGEISAVTAEIRGLEDDVTSATARLATLEYELALHQSKLLRVTALLKVQTRRMNLTRRQHALAQRQLSTRLIEMYESDDPSTVAVFLAATSIGDLLDGLEYVTRIGEQDRRIADQVAVAKREITLARAKTFGLRKEVAAVTKVVAARAGEQRTVRDRLLAAQNALASARREKQDTLAAVQTSKEEFLHEVAGLERQSANLAARIRAAQGQAVYPSSSYDSTPSARGLIWPVAGPVTSGFGWRWGRMHEGIDIGAPSGATIQASASGTVIYAGWMGGYGNLVVVDHGGGLATAYAHQSSIGSGIGQQVSQGQVIGYVGCTGHCFGNHLHFEVRVNGSPVDPLGYL